MAIVALVGRTGEDEGIEAVLNELEAAGILTKGLAPWCIANVARAHGVATLDP